MNKFVRVLIMVVAVMVASCENESDDFEALSMPLAVGNTWEYSMPSGSLGLPAEYSAKFHREVISSRIFNGKTYYELDEYYTWSGSNEIYDYSSGKWFLSNVPDSGISSIFTDQAFNIMGERMLYDPKVRQSISYGDSVTVTFSNNIFTLDGQKYESVLLESVSELSSGTFRHSLEIAPEIGIVFDKSGIEQMELISYKLVSD